MNTITYQEIREKYQLSVKEAQQYAKSPAFPKPIDTQSRIVSSPQARAKQRRYDRKQIEAFFKKVEKNKQVGQKLSDYYTADQCAEQLKISPKSFPTFFKLNKSFPKAFYYLKPGAFVRRRYFLKSQVHDWIADNPDGHYFANKEIKPSKLPISEFDQMAVDFIVNSVKSQQART